jgi:hypothetical protein
VPEIMLYIEEVAMPDFLLNPLLIGLFGFLNSQYVWLSFL